MDDSSNKGDQITLTEGRAGYPSTSARNVDRAMAKGALWMILARTGERSLGLVSTIILVRLLAPADFGLVAMGTAVIAVCELAGQLGLDAALIQNPSATRRHYDTAWTFSVILGGIIAVALLLLAFPAARFYGEPRLAPIVLSLAFGSLVSGFENIGVVAFRKDLTFDKEFRFVFGKKLAGFLVTITLAIALRNYWALIVGIIVSRVTGVCLSYYLQDYRPRWSLEARRELFRFSKWLFASNVVGVINSRSADFIVGKSAGAHALGLFSVSYDISNLPTTELIAPINRAVFPGYALKSKDSNTLRQGFLSVIGIIAAFAIPAGVGVAATADVLVPLIFGPQWLETVPLISILAIHGIIVAMQTNCYYIYLALGKPYVATWLGVAQITILLPILTILTMRYGGIGAAYAYLASQLVIIPFTFMSILRLLGITVRQMLLVLWRPFVSAAVMFGIVRLVAHMLIADPFDYLTGTIHLTQMVLIGIVAYVSCLYAMWAISARPLGAESQFLSLLRTTRSWVRLKTCQL
jgi:O-antigen/teichoic acid export membrane protein